MARKKKAVKDVKEEKPEPILESEEKKPISQRLAKFGKIFLGILVILGGLFLTWIFLPEFIKVLEGVAGVILVLVGIIVVALGWLD